MLVFSMRNFEITKEGIVIIQWLNRNDPQLGEELYSSIEHKQIVLFGNIKAEKRPKERKKEIFCAFFV